MQGSPMRPAARRLALVALVVALVLGAGLRAAAAATPAEDLQRARDAFIAGDCPAAIPLLHYLLYPKARLARSSDLVEAHVLLGVCSFETGDRPAASREFEEALYLQADLTIGTERFSAAAVRHFEEQKAVITERNRLDAERRRIAEENERYKALLASMVVIETRPYYVNFVPFGAGQFQNGQPRKGIAFAAGQGVTGAVSAGIWLYLVGTYGFNGTVPDDDADFVRRLEQVEIGTGVACLGLMAYGIVDSLLNYRPSVQRKADESLLPRELRRKPEPRPRRPDPDGAPDPDADDDGPDRPERGPRPPTDDGPTSLRLTPMLSPTGAGLALRFEF